MWWQSEVNQIHNRKEYVLFLNYENISQSFLWVDYRCYHMGSLNQRLLQIILFTNNVQ